MVEIELCAVGGYEEVGKNMTAVRVNDEVILLDMGLELDNYIKLQDEREDITKISTKELIKNKAIPDISAIKDWKDKVKAIICTHVHLDHMGAIPFLADKYKCPILGTPYTIELLKIISKDNKMRIKNPLKSLNQNSKYKISDNITIEFVNVTHSAIQTVLIAIHTKNGTIMYANDFKFDMFPTMGKKTKPERFKEFDNVHALIVDSLYANNAKKMPSESVAKTMLRDVLVGTSAEDKTIIISTFSSHLARLDSIIQYAKQIGRKVMFLGRSLSKYVYAGENLNLIKFSKDVETVRFGSEIRRKLKKIIDKRHEYVFVVTGHQGEPNAVLSRIANGQLPLRIEKGDHVIFSCNVIPSPINEKNRKVLEKKIKSKGARIFKDIHVSGHGAREDLRELIKMTKPNHIIPTHGNSKMKNALATLAIELGYKTGRTVHLIDNKERVVLS